MDGPVPEEPRLTCAGSVAAQRCAVEIFGRVQGAAHFFLALCRSLSTKITEREMTKLQASNSPQDMASTQMKD